MRWLFIVAGLCLFGFSAMGADSCATEEEKPAVVAQDPPNLDGENVADGEEPVVPEPDGTYEVTCDYLLGDFTDGSESGYKFVAGGTLHNTGNIGIVARVRARWEQLGAAPITEERRVRLRVGQRKRVAITRLASQNEIDAHQSAGFDACSTAVKIVNTFGKPGA